MTVFLISALCYVALAMGGIPGTRVDRTGIALVGAVLMLATGAVDLQNMLIGSFSGIPYLTFAARLTPAALAGLALDVAVVAWVYRRVFFERLPAGSRRLWVRCFDRPEGTVPAPVEARARRRARVHRPLLRTALAVTGLLLAAFAGGVPIAVAAVAAAGALLVVGNVKPQKVYRQVDWGLLVLFAGLFIVIEGLEGSGLVARAFAAADAEHLYRPLPLSVLSMLLSNLVSNVPAVLLFRTVVPGFPDPETAWLVLAMSSTFAGNLTLIGSVANLIVVEQARAAGAPLVGFGEYLKVGVPITLLTTLVGVLLVGRP